MAGWVMVLAILSLTTGCGGSTKHPPVARAAPEQISKYYASHRHRYERAERRSFEIVERLPSPAAARAAMARLGTGTRLKKVAFPEELERGTPLARRADRRALVLAVFRARPHILMGPFGFAGHYAFFELTHIVPRKVMPLAAVKAQIERELKAGHT